MTEGLPWSVKGVEPELRTDAARAANLAGVSLGQWLNGVIRDSLVDLRAARILHDTTAPGPASPPNFHSHREMASPPMPPFQQPNPYAQPAPQAGPWPQQTWAPPPYAGPPYAQPYAPPPAYDPYAYAPPAPPRGYDPVEARLQHYARMAQGVGAPAQDERVLNVVDAAVGAMEKSVRDNERRTAAALESLTAMMERVQSAAPVAEPASLDAPRSRPDPTEALSAQLATLMDRLSALEGSIAARKPQSPPAPAASDPLTQARRTENRLGDALDALGASASPPPAGGVRPPPGRGAPVRPRVNIVRGGAASAVAEIAARQRALDTDAQPNAMLTPETQALEAIRRSIAALADQVRETKEEQVRQPEYDVRAELKDLQKSVQDLAPRRIVASVNESIRALAAKIEQSRQDGVRDSQLAPIERLLSDLRTSIEQVREPRGLETLNAAVAQLGRRIEDIGARSLEGGQTGEFRQQFADIRRMIAEIQSRSPAASMEQQIGRLADKLDQLSQRPGDGRAIATVAAAVEDLRRDLERIDPERMLAVVDQRIEDLAGRIEATRAEAPAADALDTLAQRIERRMAGLETLGARIDRLASRLDQPQPAAPLDVSDLTQRIEQRMAGLDALGTRIDTLAQRIDTAVPGTIPQANIDALTRRIDEMRREIAGRQGPADFSSVEKRIADIQQTLDRKIPTQPDVKGLEMILRKLAERIEAVRAPAPDAGSLDALQNQIMALAERLDRSTPAMPGLEELEKTIGDLCRVVGGVRESAVAAAQEAVRGMVPDAGGFGGGMDPLAAEGMLLIKRDLTELKNAQAESDARAIETMQAVSGMLEKVASRLGALETEMTAPRAMPAAVQASTAPIVPAMTEAPVPALQGGMNGRAAPQLARPAPAPAAVPSAAPAAPAAHERPAGPMPTGAGDPGLDLPLEPGAGRNAGPAGADVEETPAAPSDPRASFIAAARRAAQAAASQSSAALADMDVKSSASKAVAKLTAGGGKLDGLKSVLAERRKPLLLGLAALIFALGGLKMATGFLFPDDPLPEPTVQIQEPKKESRLAPPIAAESPRAGTAQVAPAAPAAPAPEVREPAADRTTVGSIGETARTGAAPVTPAPAEVLPPAATPARPLDVSELMKQVPFKGPDRLKQAAVNGNLAAIYEIGARYADGRGVSRDLKAAAKWLEFAAAQGYAPAQYRFGSFNREGLGIQQDAKVAFQWFMKAAEQGHILAMHNLAVLYAEGVTGSPDYGAAAAWFRNAAEHGVKDSQFNIAILHVRGLGVAQDMVEAYKWFAIAAQQGDADAIKRRDEVAARLSAPQLADGKGRAEEFRPRRPDMRANDIGAPEGGWDQAPRAPGQPKKTKV